MAIRHMRNGQRVNATLGKAINVFFNIVGRKHITHGNVQGALEDIDDKVDELNSKLETLTTVSDLYNIVNEKPTYFEQMGSYNNYIKIGKQVEINIDVNVKIKGDGTDLYFTLPPGFRPRRNLRRSVKVYNESNAVAYVWIHTDGRVLLYSSTVNTRIMDYITFSV